MSGARRVNDQRLAVSDVGQVREQLYGVDQLDTVGLLLFQSVALDAEAEDRTTAVRQVLLREAVTWVRFQVGVVNPRNLLVTLQKLSDGQSVLTVPFHAKVQCFQSLQEHPGVERAHG